MAVNLAQPILGPFRIGQRNDGVRLVQERLNEVLDRSSRSGLFGLGHVVGGVAGPRFVALVADGAFGSKTQAAVIQFQNLRQLRADGVVGPITAKALGFTQYSSLQRLGAGAMQLASAITGSLARLIPPPHAEPDLAYSALVAMAVQADVMRRMLGTIGTVPGLGGMTGELDQIVAGVQQRLASARSQRFLENAARQAQDYAQSTHGQLMRLSQQVQRAVGQQAQPGSPLASVAQAAARQSEMIAQQGAILRALGSMGMLGRPRHEDPADALLKIAAAFARTANTLPHF